MRRIAIALALLVLPLGARAAYTHPEELVESFEDGRNQQRALPREPDRYGGPLWELDARVPFVGSPVHEKLTVAAINASTVHGRVYKVDYDEAYIHGVFWNDDPERLLCPACSILNLRRFDRRWGLAFAVRFEAAKKVARADGAVGPTKVFGRGDRLLERSHFGDLQFLHGMASRDGEPAGETQANILRWAEFAYKVATGAISAKLTLAQIPMPEVRQLFDNDPTWGSRKIEDVFHGPRFAKRVAIGTLLHIIQDSYALGHADRVVGDRTSADGKKVFSRGAIREFHAYANQDPMIHAEDDRWPDGLDVSVAGTDDNPVAVGAKVLRFVYALDGEGAPWPEVETYLRTTVFVVTDVNAPASPGARYRRR